MNHHLSWYNFLPLYERLYLFLQNNYANTVVFNSGFMPNVKVFETVTHIYATALIVFLLLISAIYLSYILQNCDAYLVPQSSITYLNVMDIFYEKLSIFMHGVIGAHYKKHTFFVGSMALFILVSNFSGLVPGSYAPTSNLNTTFACGSIVFFYFNYQGLKACGMHHITHLANPLQKWWGWFLFPLFLPIEVVGLCIRPISLATRLAGNMIGDHSVMATFVGIMPLVVPIPFIFFGTLICLIQTFVFTLLTCIYISLHTLENH